MLTLPSQVHTALDRLTAAGWEAYVVGGAVRDALRGCAAGDWDITTNAEPAQVERVFAGERLIETGLRHGTVTVLLDGLPLDDHDLPRRRGTIPDHRRPDAVRFTRSLREDLLRPRFHDERAGLQSAHGAGRRRAAGRRTLRAALCAAWASRTAAFQEDGAAHPARAALCVRARLFRSRRRRRRPSIAIARCCSISRRSACAAS